MDQTMDSIEARSVLNNNTDKPIAPLSASMFAPTVGVPQSYTGDFKPQLGILRIFFLNSCCMVLTIWTPCYSDHITWTI